MMSNTVEYVGGPWDGQLEVRRDLRAIPVFTVDWPPASAIEGPLHGSLRQRHTTRLAGHYVHGSGPRRGKMIWQSTPAPREPSQGEER